MQFLYFAIDWILATTSENREIGKMSQFWCLLDAILIAVDNCE